MFSGTEGVAVLAEVVRAEPPQGRFSYRPAAIAALASIGPDAKEALPALAEVYGKVDSYQRRTVLDTMRKIDPKSVARLGR